MLRRGLVSTPTLSSAAIASAASSAPLFLIRRRLPLSPAATTASTNSIQPQLLSSAAFCATSSSSPSSASATAEGTTTVPPSQQARAGPYRQVGNMFLIQCTDIPAKHNPAVNKLLRDLRLEFKGQWVVMADTPTTREKLFRIRHVVRIEMVSLDEMKTILGIPQHIDFRDLAAGLPTLVGRGPSVAYPYVRAHVKFAASRRMRMKDILARDAVELKLLEAKKRQKKLEQQHQSS